MAIGLTSMASFVVHLVLTARVLVSIGLPTGRFPSRPISWPLAVSAVLLIGFGVHTIVRHLPPRFQASIRTARRSIGGLRSSRSRLGLLLVGTLVVTLGHGLAFGTVANALGINAPITYHGVASLSGT